jgi:hypothetical protein
MSSNQLPGWADQARRLLDESVQALDGATASRLNCARQAALAVRPARRRLWIWLPAGLAGACALLLAVGLWQARVPPAPGMPVLAAASGETATASDLDLIASGDSLEMVQDLDFYAWLDSQDSGSDG